MKFMTARLFAAAVIAAIAADAPAAEWAIEPSVESRANMTDNINFMPNVHENVFNWTVAPKVVFASRTEATEVAGTASLGINRYPGNSQFDTNDANLSLTSQLHDERNSYGMSAAFIRDSTLASELATTGIVLARAQRNLVSASPSWNYSITERSSIFAQYRYDKANYEAGAGLINYSNQQTSSGYQYLVSEGTVATVSGSYSRYEADDGSFLTNSYGLNVGLTHSPTESLTFGLGIGAQRSDTTITSSALLCEFGSIAVCNFFGIPLQPVTATSKTSDTGLSYNTSVDYKWERTSANLSLGRNTNPTGTGLVVQTDGLTVGFRHQFSEKLSASAGGAYLISRYLGGLAADTEYYRLDSGLSWKLDEWWTAGAGYSFAYQKVKGVPDSASANTIFLSISYNWPKISMSR